MRQTVLIADDEDDVRALIAAALEEDDYDLLEASDGEDAWRLLLEHRPSMALLDIAMPGRSGLELARRITDEPSLDGMKVVMLTGIDPVQLDRELGMPEPGETRPRIDLYVLKPFTPSALREELKQL